MVQPIVMGEPPKGCVGSADPVRQRRCLGVAATDRLQIAGAALRTLYAPIANSTKTGAHRAER
jgi:hypothetical protein